VTTAQGDLDRASASTSDLMRTAEQAQERARTAASRAQSLERDATAQAEAVAEALADLRAQAQATGQELRRAWSRLEAARLAGGASCAGAPTSAANGFLPGSALCPLPGAPGHRLRADAAADFARLTAASLAERGTAVCVTDSYRSYEAQVDVFARKPQLAAVPAPRGTASASPSTSAAASSRSAPRHTGGCRRTAPGSAGCTRPGPRPAAACRSPGTGSTWADRTGARAQRGATSRLWAPTPTGPSTSDSTVVASPAPPGEIAVVAATHTHSPTPPGAGGRSARG
jgi:hypothetical protein